MKVEARIIFSILLVALTSFVFYRVSFIVAPFITALVLSYFLHPAICYFEEKGVHRILSVIFVMLAFFAVFGALVVIVLPLLYEQLILLIKTVPVYFKIYQTSFYPKIVEFLESNSIPVHFNIEEIFDPKMATDFAKNLSLGVFDSSASIVNFFSVLFIVPILVFYLLKDWKSFRSGVFNSIPKSYYDKVSNLLDHIDQSLSGYMRGQALVCVIMAFVYALLFFLTGLEFGILIGIFTGLFAFVPYVGALGGFLTAITIALFQWGFSMMDISFVLVAFLLGQFLESNLLTPRLIGDRVGLHPVWVIFGIFAFGSLFGFIGVLLSMPLTAVAGVLIKDLVFEYKKRYVKND